MLHDKDREMYTQLKKLLQGVPVILVCTKEDLDLNVDKKTLVIQDEADYFWIDKKNAIPPAKWCIGFSATTIKDDQGCESVFLKTRKVKIFDAKMDPLRPQIL